MLDPAIEAFFAERKEGWLKDKLKAGMREDEIQKIHQECDDKFSLKKWLPEAAAKAVSRAFTTHPSKFTHPDTGVGKTNLKNGTYVTPVVFKGKKNNDGFFRSGNIEITEIDSVGDASGLNVDKFLRVKLLDGRSVLEHIESKTEQVELLFNGLDDIQLRKQFLSINLKLDEFITNTKIKQVYFPVWLEDCEYHLLSPLTPSGLVFELRERIDAIRFSEQTKALRDLKRKGEFSDIGYQEIYGLTTIGYGGTKPQNISVLNNQNAGKAHLLPSLPPKITQRKLRLPTHDFFSNTLNPWQVKDTLEAFHSLISLPKEQRGSRFIEYRDRRIQEYLDYIMLTMWEIRREFERNGAQLPTQLAKVQQVWLFPDQQGRNNSDEWLEGVILLIAQQFMRHYKKVLGKKAISLGDDELAAIADVIAINKELLR
ncbi:MULTISPECIES: type I-F CRISPR-associated protein Csy1 [Providencia]|uniref:type I-F CRISPR-associated protein Csy1 n=1 Tax=Providencia TaxID=586 RepID=UPI00140DE73B|nr:MULTISPECIES: type I-F CRISPR-associated protein Csy1 [Providencia]MBG5928353.1 type I-F CRISPR-associated protein Csy1 [Providencia rettgeri]MCK9790157.1 type I-F CRISPR-associated protein Csy1 [Providencia rettgeri]MDX7422078.1 type I-F CRISPR-associated protein Csy1 [Providencia sp. CIM-Carb-044]